MAIKIGINGYGRIGRNILRAIHESGHALLAYLPVMAYAVDQNLFTSFQVRVQYGVNMGIWSHK